jgi:hypothetical protein
MRPNPLDALVWEKRDLPDTMGFAKEYARQVMIENKRPAQSWEITVPLCESFAAVGIDISEADLRKFEKALFERGLNVAHRRTADETKQEPVAWRTPMVSRDHYQLTSYADVAERWQNSGAPIEPLYAHPPSPAGSVSYPPAPYVLPFKVVGGCIQDANNTYVAEISAVHGLVTREAMVNWIVNTIHERCSSLVPSTVRQDG